MPTSKLPRVLDRLRGLTEGPASPVSDSRLLSAFAAEGDTAAFEALLRRHGPMVLGVARRVLGNVHDAEDVHQAVFLLLARKARAIRRQESVGSWLYGVALRLAIKERTRTGKRQARERRAAGLRRQAPDLQSSWQEVREVIDQALLRLPAKFRSVLVLCYLEGHSHAAVARQLGCPVGTIYSRLAEARKRLARRLVELGLQPPEEKYMGYSLLLAGAGPDMVSTALHEHTLNAALLVRAGKAAADVASARVTRLVADGGMRRTAFVILLGAGVCLGGAGVLGLLVSMPSGSAMTNLRTQNVPSGRVFSDKPEKHREAELRADAVTVSGQVVDAGGKVVPGADVAVVGRPRGPQRGGALAASGDQVLAQARADRGGRFRLTLPEMASARFRSINLVAGAAGHGLGVEPVGLDAPRSEAIVRLPAEQIIHGRLLNLQGQPAANVRVWLAGVGGAETRKLGLGVPVLFWEPPKPFQPWPDPVTTDGQGRFVLRGINPDLGAEIQVHDDGFAKQFFPVRSGPARELTWTPAPAQILQGRVLAADTDRPIARTHLTAFASNYEPDLGLGGGTGMDGDADADGRYWLCPFPGKVFTLTAYPPPGEPYLAISKGVRWPTGAVQQTVDVQLPRGVPVRGRVVEEGSGKPVDGAVVAYLPRRDTPGLKENMVVGWNGAVLTEPDGTFQTAVLPGRGHLLVRAGRREFVRQETTSGLLDNGRPGGWRVYPDGLAALNLRATDAAGDIVVKVRRGVTVRGKLVGPDGTPVAEALMLSRLNLRDDMPNAPEETVRGGGFELRVCDPDRECPVYFLDPRNQRAAVLTVLAKAGQAPLTVSLVPCGRAEARFVDGDGKPIGGYQPMLEVVLTPGVGRFDRAALARGELLADAFLCGNVDRWNYRTGPATDTDGRVTLPALIPGATYRITTREEDGKMVTRDFTVESGKTTQLGVISNHKPR